MKSLKHLCIWNIPMNKATLEMLPMDLREPDGYLAKRAKHTMFDSDRIDVFGEIYEYTNQGYKIIVRKIDGIEMHVSYIPPRKGHVCECVSKHCIIQVGNFECGFCKFGLMYVHKNNVDTEYEVSYLDDKVSCINVRQHITLYFSFTGEPRKQRRYISPGIYYPPQQNLYKFVLFFIFLHPIRDKKYCIYRYHGDTRY
jgi:hypothetical protein